MTDGELEELARCTEELTEIAREVLREEMSRRGLTSLGPDLCEVPSPDHLGDAHPDPGEQNLVTVAAFADRARADLAGNILRDSGIRSLVSDYGLSGIMSSGGNVQVRKEDEAVARNLLATRMRLDDAERTEDEGEQPSQAARCPHCGSEDIFFDGPDTIAENEELAETDGEHKAEPSPAGVWRCLSCNKEWYDQDDEPAKP